MGVKIKGGLLFGSDSYYAAHTPARVVSLIPEIRKGAIIWLMN